MNAWHRRWRVFTVALLLGAVVGFVPRLWAAPDATQGAATLTTSGFVAQIDMQGAIGPAMAEYYHDAARQAARDGARAIVLRIDTPGGLSSSMHAIIADILASPIPVIGYVSPGGARAASAGTYILYACHIAAMAPATHLGAATPVSLGGSTPMPSPTAPPAGTPLVPTPHKAPAAKSTAPTKRGNAEDHKVLNDAIAYIRSLAELRHRNATWAVRAVRGAATLTAREAVKDHVVDFIAPTVASALQQADGRRISLDSKSVTIHGLGGLPVRDYPMNWRLQFLSVITNPTIAYGLLLAGIWGLVLEAFHPGAFLPGTVGAISLLVALYALHLLPVDYAGLALIVLGLGMIIAEVLMPSIGLIGLGGIVSFVIGSVMLFDAAVPGYGVNLGLIAGIAVFAAGLLLLVLWLLMRSRRRRPTIGAGDELTGAHGVMLEALDAGGEAWASVHGERWRVRSAVALAEGTKVRVAARDGLLLTVEPQ
ncbi:MAG TPA: nodulation protein NfeD [Nevskiaceae bacterium]|nr:nodulation protein NfeD [Nevskiaceae bacterium]